MKYKKNAGRYLSAIDKVIKEEYIRNVLVVVNKN